MRTASQLDAVMASFKAPTNYARFFFAGDAQHVVDGLTQGELRGFGLDGFLEVNGSDSEHPVVSFGPFDEKVKASALFRRLEQLFDTERNRLAKASIDMSGMGSGPLHLSILTVFGALKAAGAELSSEINHVDTRPSLNEDVAWLNIEDDDGFLYEPPTAIFAVGPWTSTFPGKLHATICRNNVMLTCSAEIACEQTGTKQGEYGPIAIRRLGDKMYFEASVFEHNLATVGHRVLEDGLRNILESFVDGSVPFSMSHEDNSLIVGVRAAVNGSHIREASQELGIGMDGAVVPLEQ